MYRILSREDLCGYNNYGSNNRVDIRLVCSCLAYSNFHGTCCNYYYYYYLFIYLFYFSTQSPNWQEQEVSNKEEK